MEITKEQLLAIAPATRKVYIRPLLTGFARYFERYDITTKLRVAHFLAQAAHESAGFRTMSEYASGRAYEGRKDLGNVRPGDGPKFKGRGIFQLTGRANYASMGKRVGHNLEIDPIFAADPLIAVQIACIYWNDRALNKFADADNILRITKVINGGYNGLADRKIYLKRAKIVFGV